MLYEKEKDEDGPAELACVGAGLGGQYDNSKAGQ